MNIRKIIREELQDQYGEYVYLWVTPDESEYVNFTSFSIYSTNSLNYDSLSKYGYDSIERAHKAKEYLSKHRTQGDSIGVYRFVGGERSEIPLTLDEWNNLKLVKYFLGAVRQDDTNPFDKLN